MFSWLDFLKMTFTERLILSLPTEGLILSWVTQVRGDVVILRLFHIQEAWTVFTPKRCLLPESPWLFHTHFRASTYTAKHLRAFSFWRCFRHAKSRDNYHCYLFLTHIPVLSCGCTIHSKPMETEVCALGFCFSGQMVSAAVLWVTKVPIVPCPYSCEWGWACSTWAAPHLWLCYAASLSTAAAPALVLLWLYAPERPRRALHQSHTHQHLPAEPGLSWQPRSCSSPAQRTDFSSPCQQPVDVLVHQAQQGTTLHHERHWQCENWMWRVSKLQHTLQRVAPRIRGVDEAAMLFYPDLSSLNST